MFKRNKILTLSISLLALFTVILIGCGNTNKAESGKSSVLGNSKSKVKPTFKVKEKGLYAEMQTTKGNILLQLYFEQTPLTVTNFVGLAEGTIKNSHKGENEPYYDGLKFHRVIKDFMIQGGDPDGRGSGGPGYDFADETTPDLKHDRAGILSMANAGPHTNGSQFFITHKETPHLDNIHTVFGHVVEGQDVVNAIQQNDVINHVIIIRKGKAAKKFKADQANFDELVANGKKALRQTYKAYAQQVANDLCNGQEVKEAGDGVFYCITKNGDGEKAARGQTVDAKYKGYFPDGKVFDQGTYPFALETGPVIKGWHSAFKELKVGDQATVVIPYWEGYGERQGRMKARATLVFDVEFLGIK